MRKANPAFCERSKSHKKLDPFDDRKMVRRLPENLSPFAVPSRMWYCVVLWCTHCACSFQNNFLLRIFFVHIRRAKGSAKAYLNVCTAYRITDEYYLHIHINIL